MYNNCTTKRHTEQENNSETQWYGCYDGSWQGLITPEAFSHPAKFSFALIKRIYEFMLSQDYIHPGEVILDPFGGMGGGAVANFYGLNWVGVELEARFVDLGQGCDCTGISKADWVRFYGRWDKANYKEGRHWCPDCLAQARQVTERRQLSLFEPEPSAAYTRNSGLIPETLPHRYRGNLELFRKYARPGTYAVLLQGDSRYLRQVVGRAQVDGLLSSPPYAQAQTGGEAIYDQLEDKYQRRYIVRRNGYQAKLQGVTPGQLGAMKPGDLDGLLSSPPFAGNTGGRGEASRNGIDAALFDRHSGGMKRGTGENPDNLDHLSMKGLAEALISSPPYERSNQDYASGYKYAKPQGGTAQTNYGQTAGQLGALPSGSFDAAISSPPYANQPTKTNPVKENSWSDGKARPVGISQRNSSGYGDNSENLGNLPPGSFDAALSSPPYADSVGSDDPGKRGGLLKSDPRRAGDRNLTGSYGASEGQLGAMKAGGLVTSPPFEDCNNNIGAVGNTPGMRQQILNSQRRDNSYGSTPGQLGTESKETFWSAAKMIVSECFEALKPGAYSAWVCKAFIRDGQRVEFPDQWRQLCEACGFEFVEEIRAMLVTEKGVQIDLNGEDRRQKVERKSFFRRLHESRLAEDQAHLRIDWETVVIMRKPG